MKEKEVELAKSWFVLAIILASIAWLSIMASALAATFASNIFYMEFSSSNYICSDIVQNVADSNMQDYFFCLNNVNKILDAPLNMTIKISTFLLMIGVLLVANAIMLFIIGRQKLKYHDLKDEALFGIVVGIDIVVCIAAYFATFKPF